MRVGEVIQAKVVSVHEYGIYLEAQGLVGFVQVIELSWRRGVGPMDVASAGDMIDVLVLAVSPERFSASIKDVHPELDPWREANDFDVGSEHDGIITKKMDWGIVVAIRPEVDGVVVGRGMGLRIGDRVHVVVTVCQRADRRIEFELKT